MILPGVDLGNEAIAAFVAAIETLAFEHADLNLNHVEPAGRAWGRSGTRGAPRPVGRRQREVVEDDADALGFREVDIDELAHAKGKVVRDAMIGDLTCARNDGHRGRRRD